jgi:hypothetical protein
MNAMNADTSRAEELVARTIIDQFKSAFGALEDALADRVAANKGQFQVNGSENERVAQIRHLIIRAAEKERDRPTAGKGGAKRRKDGSLKRPAGMVPLWMEFRGIGNLDDDSDWAELISKSATVRNALSHGDFKLTWPSEPDDLDLVQLDQVTIDETRRFGATEDGVVSDRVPVAALMDLPLLTRTLRTLTQVLREGRIDCIGRDDTKLSDSFNESEFAAWLEEQRRAYFAGLLTTEQIALLDAIPSALGEHGVIVDWLGRISNTAGDVSS